MYFVFIIRVDVEFRQGAIKLQARGIFVGAKVVRGPDWDWGNQVSYSFVGPNLHALNILDFIVAFRTEERVKSAESWTFADGTMNRAIQ